jgi:signal transduction histidine kinase
MPLFPLPPSRRAGAGDLDAQARILDAVPALRRILDALPTMAMLLNRQRQLVLANHRLIEFASTTGIDDLCGFRPGEILHCGHALDSPEGCGSTEHCTVCGALQAIVTAQFGLAQNQLCRLQLRTPSGDQPLELDISASPIEIGGEQFTVVCAADAAGRLERERLEHSAVPQAVELALEMEILAASIANPGAPPEARERATEHMAAASRRIATLMREHAELASAETGGLSVARSSVSALEILRDTAREFEYHPAATGRRIRIASDAPDATLDTDPALARHALEKIVLNALEATAPGGVVEVGCRLAAGRMEFWVRNDGQMPRDVQLQVFQRAFSTRGRGRGYGTYFAKLIAERYLNGTLSFRSTVEEGTTFCFSLPLT